ncbi:hypothetical protein BDW62DRAFT_172863 [Aspergillus aurantiobrunneus]
MAAPSEHRAPVPIAPAPARLDGPTDSSPSAMLYTCRTCSKRKVKCGKATPRCSSCFRSKLECVYQEPAPRSRKRKWSSNLEDCSPSRPEVSMAGKLLTDQGNSRYIESGIWQESGA